MFNFCSHMLSHEQLKNSNRIYQIFTLIHCSHLKARTSSRELKKEMPKYTKEARKGNICIYRVINSING